ncbi:MAG: hypothetical protein J0L93_00710 [Deltaproteobacteria bacterium]|nr:hypothetical protein [Deltaproteobacteria bacterium]
MWKDLPTSFKNILGDPIFVVLPTPTDVALVVQVDANTIGVEVFRLLADHRFMRIAHFTSSDGEQLNLLKQEFSADATSSIDLTPHVNEKGALILNILQFSPQRKAKVYEFDLPK